VNNVASYEAKCGAAALDAHYSLPVGNRWPEHTSYSQRNLPAAQKGALLTELAPLCTYARHNSKKTTYRRLTPSHINLPCYVVLPLFHPCILNPRVKARRPHEATQNNCHCTSSMQTVRAHSKLVSPSQHLLQVRADIPIAAAMKPAARGGVVAHMGDAAAARQTAGPTIPATCHSNAASQ
jgi:hypothetical protein